MSTSKLGTEYPLFSPVTLTDREDESVANKRLKRFHAYWDVNGVPLWLEYEKREIFWLPVDKVVGITDWDKKKKHRISEFFRRCMHLPGKTCWNWFGGHNGSYPAVHYNGKLVGALKVLLADLCEDHPGSFPLNKLCKNPACVNPAHYHISCDYNVPIAPGLHMSKPSVFWKYPQVLPWEHKEFGKKTIAKVEAYTVREKIPGDAPPEIQSYEEFLAFLNPPKENTQE